MDGKDPTTYRWAVSKISPHSIVSYYGTVAHKKSADYPKATMASTTSKANVLMVGTGEYTTGYVGGKAADSDKGAGVVALTMFDLRRRDKVDRVGMCGVNVRKGSVAKRIGKHSLLAV